MTAHYYNEIDNDAANAIEALIAAGELPPGYVDRRSIEDVRPADLAGFVQVHLFAGIGGWPLALRLAGFPADEPIWTGSCPCQPFSAAGKRAGIADERHLWPAMRWLIDKCRPTKLRGEQVASKPAESWFATVRSDLEAMGYAVGAVAFPAAGVGAQFIGDRLYWAADALAAPERHEQPRQKSRRWSAGRMGWVEQSVPWNTPWQDALPSLRALGDGLPRCVGATDAARNAIVPAQAAQFILAAEGW